MTLDWKHYTIAALLLGTLATWGAREKTHAHQLLEETTAKTAAETRATTAEARITTIEQQTKAELSKAYERGRKRTETRLPDGTVTITDEEMERSLETAKEEARQSVREEYEAKLTQASTAINNLSHRINELEVEKIHNAPRWAASAGWMGDYYAGAGMNLGGITAQATYARSGMLGGVATIRF